MFQILIIPLHATANTALFFRSKETADIAHKNIHDMQKGTIPSEILNQTDDFGVTLTIDRANICYAMLIDVEKQQEIGQLMGQQQRGARLVPHP